MLAQLDENGRERAIYYLSRQLTPIEVRYAPKKKSCILVFYAIMKLRHYIGSNEVYVVSKSPIIKYFFESPLLTGRISKWSLILSPYDLRHKYQQSVKGQALADFLVDHDPALSIEQEETTEEVWQAWFDGLSTKNVLKELMVLKAKQARVKGDSQLVINQVNKGCTCQGRDENVVANSLAQLASGYKNGTEQGNIPEMGSHLQSEDNIMVVDIMNQGKDWKKPIVDFLSDSSQKAKQRIKVQALSYVLLDGVLYRKDASGVLFRSVDLDEAIPIMMETHEGLCGSH
ncbi:hypothetical protein MLD38_037789 [Melastoma candidum]|uniref:Uncharacterized protein n=1 Tax=Melastoma candidum TaxID=119954 RepID=A0ACB9LQF5_9MYRT|nr:hypothetical protein MLD38_037789 [Melastoma candidum]